MGLILLALIAIVAEILTWIFVGKLVGSAWYVFFWFIAAFFIGLNLLRSSSSHIMPQLQQMQLGGQMGNDPQVGKYLARCLSGVLLMIPGLLSDVVALILLIPGMHKLIQNVALSALQKRQQAMMNKMMGGMMGGNNAGAGSPFEDMMRQMQDMQRQQGSSQYQDSSIIDGEAREVTPDSKRIQSPKDRSSQDH
ncbi:FxsA family protein [Acinetobacter qingfengensis]|uniref:FxsA protein n=1 Tax=Acinetobacter qingfengensis TaxID=1262585 RepID=A0A1E7RDQ1_9GAMM|nr:FxsA family protein [Acinetobacter qingfengensis]KAA8735379.1 FxsA family protein [Acinetobacter qingfengensis]OEY97295.1 FxsA protein [Acinetobacter qingfengensis]